MVKIFNKNLKISLREIATFFSREATVRMVFASLLKRGSTLKGKEVSRAQLFKASLA